MKCPIKYCRNSNNVSGKTGPQVNWHRIPANDKMRKLWLEACWKSEVVKKVRVCSEHFSNDDYFSKENQRSLLKCDAVPKG